MCQMPNIWHLVHQTPKTNPHQLFQISKNLTHSYSNISNMRRYRHQCQKHFGLFNSFFSLLLSDISLRLQHISLSLSLSLSLWNSHRPLAILRDKDRPGSPPITNPLCDEEELRCERHSGRK